MNSDIFVRAADEIDGIDRHPNQAACASEPEFGFEYRQVIAGAARPQIVQDLLELIDALFGIIRLKLPLDA